MRARALSLILPALLSELLIRIRVNCEGLDVFIFFFSSLFFMCQRTHKELSNTFLSYPSWNISW